MLPYYYITMLPYYYITMLLCYYITILLYYHVTILLCYYVITLLYYNKNTAAENHEIKTNRDLSPIRKTTKLAPRKANPNIMLEE